MRKMRKNLLFLIILLSLIAVVVARGHGHESPGSLVVVMEKPRQPLSDFGLEERLNRLMSLHCGHDVIYPREDKSLPQAPKDRFDAGMLMQLGQENGSRYIVYTRTDNRRLKSRKKFTIPFILNHYVVEGRLTGDFALIDLNRGKVVNVWQLDAVVPGQRKWQINDDYPDDPDLQVSAPQKARFLEKLKDKAVIDIITALEPHIHKGR